MVLPGIAAIFSCRFVNIWNELFIAVMLISTNTKMTVPVALNSFISKAGISWGILSAGIVIALLPTMRSSELGSDTSSRGSRKEVSKGRSVRA